MPDANYSKELDTLPREFPGMKAISSQVSQLMGCRSYNQFCCTLRALTAPLRFCPFCETELGRRKRVPLQVFDDWLLLKNEFPHKSTERMLLIVPKRHLTSPYELTGSDWGNVGKALSFCQHQLFMQGGGLLMRFGNSRLNVGTIEHLHMNVIEPMVGKEYRMLLAKNTEELQQDYERLVGFRDKMNSRPHPILWLFSEQGIAETEPKL